MPTQFSKFIDTSCKEFLHPWEDSCSNATTGLGLHALQESMKIYCSVYILASLIKGKKASKEDIKKTILDILQSTAFLGWNSFSYSMFICSIRYILGGFTVWSISFLPSFLSSLTAIFIERPSRRTALGLYVANVATETLFRMGLARNYYSAIPNGGTYIFATSIALLLYFFRSKTNKHDSIYGILRILIGQYEDPDYIKRSDSQSKQQTCPNSESLAKINHTSKKYNKKNLNIFMKSLEVYQKIINQLKLKSKHSSCPHPHSCAHYVLKGSIKVLGYALSAQLVFKLVFQMKTLFRKPQLLKSVIFKQINLNLAVFLGSFTGIYRLVSCLLRRSFQKDSCYYAIPAGLIAGLTFMAYSSNTIALYVMWKALQLLWNDLAEKKIVPEVKWFAVFFYAFSTAVLFHVAVLEPQHLRPSYWKFLYNISGGRIAVMSRIPLDQFGLESSRHLAEVLRKTNTTDKHTFKF